MGLFRLFAFNQFLILLLHSINLRWLRNQIAVVEQSTTLFPGTILDNIALGKQDATLEEVVNAAKLVDLRSVAFSSSRFHSDFL